MLTDTLKYKSDLIPLILNILWHPLPKPKSLLLNLARKAYVPLQCLLFLLSEMLLWFGVFRFLQSYGVIWHFLLFTLLEVSLSVLYQPGIPTSRVNSKFTYFHEPFSGFSSEQIGYCHLHASRTAYIFLFYSIKLLV